MPLPRNIAGTTSGQHVQLANQLLDVYSQEILFAAQPVLKFMSIATKRTELLGGPGETVKFLKYASLTGGSAITETDTIVPVTLSTSVIGITVTEHAKAVSVSQKLLQTALSDVMGDASRLLGMHYGKAVDALIRNTLLGSSNVVFGSTSAGAISANRAGLSATHTFNMDAVLRAVEGLATRKASKVAGDAWVCFVHPRQARFIRSSAGWVSVMQYADPSRIFNGEIGRIEDVRFIETTMVPYIVGGTTDRLGDNGEAIDTVVGAAPAGVNVYQAIVVGENAVGFAESLPVEMRDNGVEDFGRTHSLAYYGIWGAGLVDDIAVAVIETA